MTHTHFFMATMSYWHCGLFFFTVSLLISFLHASSHLYLTPFLLLDRMVPTPFFSVVSFSIWISSLKMAFFHAFFVLFDSPPHCSPHIATKLSPLLTKKKIKIERKGCGLSVASLSMNVFSQLHFPCWEEAPSLNDTWSYSWGKDPGNDTDSGSLKELSACHLSKTN